MTTKTPSSVKAAAPESDETIAYESVKDISTVDAHDRDRLGYNVWRWLSQRKDPLELAVRSAGARLLISEAEAVEKIRGNLKKRGISTD